MNFSNDEARIIIAALRKTGGGDLSALIAKVEKSTLVDGKYTREQLEAAFDRVKPEGHWKNPIRRTFDGKLSDEEKAVIRAAIIFYTGSVPKFTEYPKQDLTKVVADGYFLAIGA